MASETSRAVQIILLVALSLTGTVYLLLLRYTRISTKEKYITTTTVAMQESIKFVMALCILIFQSNGISGAISLIRRDIINKPSDMIKMAVPSVVYAIQNNMTYLALSNLDVAVQQILYQLKIPATALMMTFLLGKKLSVQQWVSLFMVFMGAALVEYDPHSGSSAHSENGEQNPLLGVFAVGVAVLCSAFAGVYFEKMVKGSDTSLWIRNLQMYTWSVMATFIAVATSSYSEVQEKGFFYAYTPLVWVVICIAGVNGLIVSLVVKYLDNIIKGFSAATSIIFAIVLSYLFLGSTVGLLFIIGALVVCCAITLYALPLPFIDPRYTTVPMTTVTKRPEYEKLPQVVVDVDEEEVNTSKN